MSEKYRTFKRTAKNWEQFARASKRTVDRNLTYEEAQRSCAEFNNNRTAAQVKAGTKMEFESQ